jgi:hypothetical protein
VRAAVPDHPAKAAQGGAAVWFLVVRQPIQVALNVERRFQARNQPALSR